MYNCNILVLIGKYRRSKRVRRRGNNMENLAAVNLGVEIYRAFYRKKYVYEEEVNRKFLEHKEGTTAFLPAVSSALVGTGASLGTKAATGIGIPLVGTAAEGLVNKLIMPGVPKFISPTKMHRAKAKRAHRVLCPESGRENLEQFRNQTLEHFVEAVAQLLIAYRSQVNAIAEHENWTQNYRKLAHSLTQYQMNYLTYLSREQRKHVRKNGLESALFINGFIKGATKGFKQKRSMVKELLTLRKLKSGQTLEAMVTKGCDLETMTWTTTGMLLCPGIVVHEQNCPVVFVNSDSRVKEYGYRLALQHELIDDYAILRRRGYQRSLDLDSAFGSYMNVSDRADEVDNLKQKLIEAINVSDQASIHKQPTVIEEGPIEYNWTAAVSTYVERKHLEDNVLDKLQQPVDDNDKISFCLINFYGLGGNGKTQLAKKICSIVRAMPFCNGNLIWLNADEEKKLRNQLQNLLEARGDELTAYGRSASEIRSRLYKHALNGRSCVIVFDNVTNFEMALNYMPVDRINTNVKVLMTSKKELDWGQEKGKVHNILVDVLTVEETITFVKKFTAGIGPTTKQLVDVMRKTSCMPATLSLLCHSFQCLKKYQADYTLDLHLENYGADLHKLESVTKILPGTEGLEYGCSVRRSVRNSVQLLESIRKQNVGPFAVFLLKHLAFCSGEALSKKELVHVHPGIRARAEQCKELRGNVTAKIDHALGLISSFGFIQEVSKPEFVNQEDIYYYMHHSYQDGMIADMWEQNHMAGKQSNKQSEAEDILMGLVKWMQLEEVPNLAPIGYQKFVHGQSIWMHVRETPHLVMELTKTHDMLHVLLCQNDLAALKTWAKHCQQDLVSVLLTDTYVNRYRPTDGQKHVSNIPALCDAAVELTEGEASLEKLVMVVKDKLDELEVELLARKKNSFKSFKASFQNQRHRSSAKLTPDFINRQMEKVVFYLVRIPLAVQIICLNFPLRYSNPLSSIKNRTLLHWAAKFNRSIEDIRAIVHSGHSYNGGALRGKNLENFIDAQDGDGCTALHYAISHGSTNVVEFLLESGANPETRNREGDTTLHCAAECLTSVLLESSGSPDLESYAPKNPLGFTLWYASTQIPRNMTILIAERFFLITQLLLSKIKNKDYVNAKNDDGLTALHLACLQSELSNIDQIRALLNGGADPNATITGSGHTSLHIVSKVHNLELVKLLLRHGGSLTVTNFNGKKPIDILKEWKSSENFPKNNAVVEEEYCAILKLLRSDKIVSPKKPPENNLPK